VGGLEVVAVGQLLDLFLRQAGEELAGQHAQEGIAQPVDAFEVLKKQDEPFEMRGLELAVNAVKRVRHGMRDLGLLEISLQLVNVFA
jgi:hypothetical protein